MVQYSGSSADGEQIVSHVSMILGTVRGSMPYMRDMGISGDIVGRNTPEAADAYVDDASDQVELWDNRVMVGEIEVEQDAQGKIQARVVLEDVEEL
ncbi:MAG: hypothetical protein HFH62_04510 [Lachnospiraceae bacterium]|nr:hypothetical protein [Lachnospiraceae bacterium]